jgi:hypothetical protein
LIKNQIRVCGQVMTLCPINATSRARGTYAIVFWFPVWKSLTTTNWAFYRFMIMDILMQDFSKFCRKIAYHHCFLPLPNNFCDPRIIISVGQAVQVT